MGQEYTKLYYLLGILSFFGTFLWNFIQNNNNYMEKVDLLLNSYKVSPWRSSGFHHAKSACASLLGRVLQLCWYRSVITEMEQRIQLTLTHGCFWQCRKPLAGIAEDRNNDFNGVTISFT